MRPNWDLVQKNERFLWTFKKNGGETESMWVRCRKRLWFLWRISQFSAAVCRISWEICAGLTILSSDLKPRRRREMWGYLQLDKCCAPWLSRLMFRFSLLQCNPAVLKLPRSWSPKVSNLGKGEGSDTTPRIVSYWRATWIACTYQKVQQPPGGARRTPANWTRDSPSSGCFSLFNRGRVIGPYTLQQCVF